MNLNKPISHDSLHPNLEDSFHQEALHLMEGLNWAQLIKTNKSNYFLAPEWWLFEEMMMKRDTPTMEDLIAANSFSFRKLNIQFWIHIESGITARKGVCKK